MKGIRRIVICICALLLILCTACNAPTEAGSTDGSENHPSDSSDPSGSSGSSAAVEPAREAFTDAPLCKLGLESENVEILVPGLEQEYHFIWISDMHIITESGEISANDYETVTARRDNLFVDADKGRSALEQWEAISRALDSCHADGILFGADMVDFASMSNMRALTAGFDRISTPYMYLRADHDSEPYFCDGITHAECDALHAAIDGNPAVQVMEYPGFMVVGISDSTSNMTPEALAEFEGLYAKGIPVILATHVPIASKVDDSLSKASREVWQDRNLIWAYEDADYLPTENTAGFLDRVYSTDGIVRCVLAGHLHLEWDGELTESVHEHVFGAAYEGKYGVITVKGGEG